MNDFFRTHNCGELRTTDIGKEISLSGWVHRHRDHGGLIFIDLRDRFGITQLVFNPETNPKEHAIADRMRSEWVIHIKGTVRPRAEGMANPKLETGSIEIYTVHIDILSPADTPPFSICDDHIDIHEDLRMKYRYLDIRRGDIANKLAMRHAAMMATRQYLDSHQFLEITTPILGKSTPEGARDYLVPSRIYPGKFYALPQSPQMFKQLLMIGGLDRYFQIASCFRDEDLRADRQPEFTQIDMEMSFGTAETFLPIVEGLLKAIFKKCINIDIPAPFRRISYSECMERFGCDRPDLRFGMELQTISDIAEQSSFSVFLDQLNEGGCVKGLCVKGGSDLSRKAIEDYTTFVNRFDIQGLAWMKYQENGLSSNIVKFFPDQLQQLLIKRFKIEKGDLIFMIADTKQRTNQALDHLRRRIARDRDLIPSNRYEFLWVVDFPLFSWNSEEQRLESEHHPFTSPLFEDIDMLNSDPLKVRSSGYDVVLNGYEIGGGSQRIHNSDLQRKIFEALNLSHEELETKFGFFIEALSYGTPPHLGLALGLDRIMMILCNTESIRDVIAFPKTQKASDLMMECPSEVANQQLRELELAFETRLAT